MRATRKRFFQQCSLQPVAVVSLALIAGVSSGLAASPIGVHAPSQAVWGPPRSSFDGLQARVVFDLPPGTSYTLKPDGNTLRLLLQGVGLPKPQTMTFGLNGLRYIVDAAGPRLVTPYPLSETQGWRATETVIASGSRVLILDFGATVLGGAAGLRPVQASTPASPPAPAPPADPFAPGPGTLLEDGRQADVVSAGGKVSDLQPTAVMAAPKVPTVAGEHPSGMSGTVPGISSAGVLAPPRFGINPGLTRMVLELPPGTGYRLQPGGSQFIIDLTGPKAAPGGLQDISTEVTGWQIQPTSQGTRLTIQTGKPTRDQGGWRGTLLPATADKPARLLVDFSPALANTTPLPASQKVLAQVPPRLQSRGTGLAVLGLAPVKPVVVLDPGHGGVDSGAVGLVTEKVVTLDVAMRVRDLLTAAGVDVILTRNRDTQLSLDKTTDLRMRSALARGKQLFVSIHANSTPPVNNLRGYGIETWWNPNNPGSSQLASLIQSNVIAQTSGFDRGIKSNHPLGVLQGNPAPAALIEMGFTSHPVDGMNLRDSNYLDRVALGIALGIRAMLVN